MTIFKEGFVSSAIQRKAMLNLVSSKILEVFSAFSLTVSEVCSAERSENERIASFYELRTVVREKGLLTDQHSETLKHILLNNGRLNYTLVNALHIGGLLETLYGYGASDREERFEISEFLPHSLHKITCKDTHTSETLDLNDASSKVTITAGPRSFITEAKQRIFDLEAEYRQILESYLSNFNQLEESDQDMLENCLTYLNGFKVLVEYIVNIYDEKPNDDEAR